MRVDDRVIVSASDAGAHVQMMCAAGDTTLFLTRHVRERGDFTLEKAIWELTGAQSERLGFKDRGILAPGYAGDLTIFDLDELSWGSEFFHPPPERPLHVREVGRPRARAALVADLADCVHRGLRPRPGRPLVVRDRRRVDRRGARSRRPDPGLPERVPPPRQCPRARTRARAGPDPLRLPSLVLRARRPAPVGLAPGRSGGGWDGPAGPVRLRGRRPRRGARRRMGWVRLRESGSRGRAPR